MAVLARAVVARPAAVAMSAVLAAPVVRARMRLGPVAVADPVRGSAADPEAAVVRAVAPEGAVEVVELAAGSVAPGAWVGAVVMARS